MADTLEQTNQPATARPSAMRALWNGAKWYQGERKKARLILRNLDKADRQEQEEKLSQLDKGWDELEEQYQELARILQRLAGYRLEGTDYNKITIKHLADHCRISVGGHDKKLLLTEIGVDNKSSVCLLENKQDVISATYVGKPDQFGPAAAMEMADSIMILAPACAVLTLKGSLEEQFFMKKAIDAHNALRPDGQKVTTPAYGDFDVDDALLAKWEKRWARYIGHQPLGKALPPQNQQQKQSGAATTATTQAVNDTPQKTDSPVEKNNNANVTRPQNLPPPPPSHIADGQPSIPAAPQMESDNTATDANAFNAFFSAPVDTLDVPSHSNPHPKTVFAEQSSPSRPTATKTSPASQPSIREPACLPA